MKIENHKLKTKNSRGSILIYSLLIMSVILSVGISMNAVFLKNLRNVRQSRDSVIALYAADSAAELCLYEARSGINVNEALLTFQNGVSFNIVEISGGTVTDDCGVLGAGSPGFRATGIFKDASRALEIGL